VAVEVKAPVKATVVFLVGLATLLAGSFIRSCQSPAEFLNAWCGGAPQSLALLRHQHCAGCVLVAAGIALLALSPILISWTGRPNAAAAR
jgi:hypothetical protein